MQMLDDSSDEFIASNFTFGTVPLTNVSVQSSNIVEYPCATTDRSPYEFHINTGSAFLDLSQCYLKTTFRIFKKENGIDVPITETDDVSFINGFGSTFIQDLKVSLNGKMMYSSNGLYAYQSHFRRVLGLEVTRNRGALECEGFFEDDDSQGNIVGHNKRKKFFANGGSFETMTTLDADIFRQGKVLINNINLDISITPHKNLFMLMTSGNTEYTFKVDDCRIFVKQLHAPDPVNFEIQNSLEYNPAKYYYHHVIARNVFISPGRYEISCPLFNDFLPRRVFAALVDAKSFNGHLKLSPFEFKPYDVESISICTNGNRWPQAPYSLDWKKNYFSRALREMAAATDNKTLITTETFPVNSCIYGFDLRNDSDDHTMEPLKYGSTTISVKFTEPCPEHGLQLIVYAEFDNLLTIDKNRAFTSKIFP